MNKPKIIEGFKGGGSQRAAVESPDSLFSIANARVVDLWSEGEIEGFPDNENFLRYIFLDETPVENADGSKNFKNVSVEVRLGTQDQTYIPGFPAVESEAAVNVELTYDTPWTQSFTNQSLSAVRIRLAVHGLSRTDEETGDIKGYSVQYAIDVATDGGSFVEVVRTAFTGKTTTVYERSHRIDLPESTSSGWVIRVRRLTADSESSYIQDTTVVASYTEIIDGKFRYPMSALMGVTVDASQFQSVPTRAAHLKGRRIRVPTNYDPETRTYDGGWDGTFKIAYSNNPAWVFYDLVLHERYGLGHLVDESLMDKWSLYGIAQYCDEIVPDGFGGEEPRMTCNIYLQQRADAWRVISDLSSIFRGISYWASGVIVPVADRPTDPVYTYTNANVIDGTFQYESTGRRARYNAVIVSYNDMTDFGRIKSDYYDDPDGIARFGFQPIEVNAMGCTSRGQARRLARWILLSSKLLTNAVTFSVGMDGVFAVPGQIIRVADKHRNFLRSGGRLSYVDSTTSVTLDRWPFQDSVNTVSVGDWITVNLPSGISETRQITAYDHDTLTVTIDEETPFSELPEREAVWSIEGYVPPKFFRVASIREGEDGTYQLNAVQHDPAIFDLVDSDEPFSSVSTEPASNSQARPNEVTITATERAGAVVASTLLVAEWDAAPGAVKYQIQWCKDHGDWSPVQEVGGTTADYAVSFSGVYEAKVSAVNVLGIVSPPRYSAAYEVEDQTTPPTTVVDIGNSVDNEADERAADIAAVYEDMSLIEEDVVDLDGRVGILEGDVSSIDGRVSALETGAGSLDTRVGDLETSMGDAEAAIAVLQSSPGRIVAQSATHMKVVGNGFGTSSQFIEWFGPVMDIALCDETAGLAYLKTDGTIYP